MMSLAYVSGGSNVEPETNLRLAARELTRGFPGARYSHCYRNAAVGFSGAEFINFVVELPVTGGLPALIHELERIEALCGRPPDAPRFAPRSMDLDVLLYGDAVGEFDGVVLPRPSLLEWGFMLGPLAELVPQRLHPLRQRTMAQLWADFDQVANPLTRVELDLATA